MSTDDKEAIRGILSFIAYFAALVVIAMILTT